MGLTGPGQALGSSPGPPLHGPQNLLELSGWHQCPQELDPACCPVLSRTRSVRSVTGSSGRPFLLERLSSDGATLPGHSTGSVVPLPLPGTRLCSCTPVP